MKDTSKHQGLRNQLASILKKKGITNEMVLNAIKIIPRHLFIDSSFSDHAYQDKAFPIAAEQTISQPYTVAFQSQTLSVNPGDVILEIGTGSGYQTAVLIELGAEVYTIERQHELFKKTSLFLPKLGYKPKKFIFGDGYKGFKEKAPFDKIIVTAGAPIVPKPLLAQLKVGGMLLIPVGDKKQIMTMFYRKSPKEFEKKVVYASSSSIYGNTTSIPIQESSEKNPINPYGVTKLDDEKLAKKYHDLGVPIIGLRYFNVFGPKQNPMNPYAAVIPIFCSAFINNKKPTINGDGETSRDFTFVENAVQANIKAMLSLGLENHEVFNVACGDQVSLNEMIHELNTLSSTQIEANYGPERKGDVKHSKANIDKIKGNKPT